MRVHGNLVQVVLIFFDVAHETCTLQIRAVARIPDQLDRSVFLIR